MIQREKNKRTKKQRWVINESVYKYKLLQCHLSLKHRQIIHTVCRVQNILCILNGFKTVIMMLYETIENQSHINKDAL